MDQFTDMLQSGDNLHRSIDYYAEILCISAKHLSYVSRKMTGFSAAHWVDQITILEAKHLLRTSSLAISDIANRLDFSSQSQFGSFFKKHTGMTPMEYRKSSDI